MTEVKTLHGGGGDGREWAAAASGSAAAAAIPSGTEALGTWISVTRRAPAALPRIGQIKAYTASRDRHLVRWEDGGEDWVKDWPKFCSSFREFKTLDRPGDRERHRLPQKGDRVAYSTKGLDKNRAGWVWTKATVLAPVRNYADWFGVAFEGVSRVRDRSLALSLERPCLNWRGHVSVRLQSVR